MNIKLSLISLLIVLLVNTFNLSAQIPTDSLIGYYPFSGNANDRSGNSFHGMVNGAKLDIDRFGRQNECYYFNGSSDYIEVDDQGKISGMADFSISIWANVYSFPSAFDGTINPNVLISKWTAESSTDCFLIGAHYNQTFNAAYRMDGYDSWGDLGNYHFYSSKIKMGNWIHLVYVRKSDSLLLYRNGTLDQVKIVAKSNYNISSKNLIIGAMVTNHFRGFHGTLDDIRIYNRDLTRKEVGDLFVENFFSNTETISKGKQENLYFPNPSKGILKINNLEASENIMIYNGFGELVFQSPLNSLEKQLDISNLSNGVYFISFTKEDNDQLKLKKLILSK